MPDGVFHFKQFSIRQDKCAMKVGTDAVLLGSWIKIIGTEKNILDIGTGTGVLALMIAQRSTARIDAIEADEIAAEQAKDNVLNSPWPENIAIHPVIFQDFVDQIESKYDLIFSNPPYFDQAYKAPEAARNLARHRDVSLTFDEIISGSFNLLNPSGRLCLILPFSESQKFIVKALQKGFFLTHETDVITRIGKAGKRVLLEFSLNNTETHRDVLILKNEDLSHHKNYLDLTKDYYPWDYQAD